MVVVCTSRRIWMLFPPRSILSLRLFVGWEGNLVIIENCTSVNTRENRISKIVASWQELPTTIPTKASGDTSPFSDRTTRTLKTMHWSRFSSGAVVCLSTAERIQRVVPPALIPRSGLAEAMEEEAFHLTIYQALPQRRGPWRSLVIHGVSRDTRREDSVPCCPEAFWLNCCQLLDDDDAESDDLTGDGRHEDRRYDPWSPWFTRINLNFYILFKPSHLPCIHMYV
jgi:hypothetical protein